MPYVALSVKGSRPDFTREGSEIPASQIETFFSFIDEHYVGWTRDSYLDPWRSYDNSRVQVENRDT